MKGMKSPSNRSTMPWDEIESGKYDGIKTKLSELIKLRNSYPEFLSNDIEFIRHEDHPRVVHYRKSGKINVFINAGEQPYTFEAEGNILYKNCYENGALKEYGVLITEVQR
jgi:glycosidase